MSHFEEDFCSNVGHFSYTVHWRKSEAFSHGKGSSDVYIVAVLERSHYAVQVWKTDNACLECVFSAINHI